MPLQQAGRRPWSGTRTQRGMGRQPHVCCVSGISGAGRNVLLMGGNQPTSDPNRQILSQQNRGNTSWVVFAQHNSDKLPNIQGGGAERQRSGGPDFVLLGHPGGCLIRFFRVL